MKTVPRNVKVVEHDELPGLGDLPGALSVALADIVHVAREGLLALSVATGMSVMQAMFEAEVTAVAGCEGQARPGTGSCSARYREGLGDPGGSSGPRDAAESPDGRWA
jgi:hypothetical protein